MSRLGRFLHIERSRPAGPGSAGDPGAATAERIEGVEQPGRALGAPTRTGAELDRFAPPPPPPLELETPAAGARPFTRCMACGMDHHVGVLECTGCGARLDDEAQRAFNEALWARRQEEAAAEAAAEAERRARRALAGDPEGGSSGTRALGEAIAREVGAAERARLDAELGRRGDVIEAVRRLVGRVLERVWR